MAVKRDGRGEERRPARGREKGEDEALREVAAQAVARWCDGDYNLVSCTSLSLLEAVQRSYREVGRFELPHFSRELVLRAHRAPPPAAGVREYVEALKKAVEAAFDAAFYYEFSLETPLTIHARWPYLPLEIGIAWHPLLNVPYIPATSLKGALRAAAPQAICGIDAAKFFGTPGQEGLATVFDAYPVEGRPIQPEVLTPHYREPEGRVSEVQAQPTPLVFPVVPPGTRFAFILAIREPEAKGCRAELLETLRRILSEGLGAKTTLGYGVFR